MRFVIRAVEVDAVPAAGKVKARLKARFTVGAREARVAVVRLVETDRVTQTCPLHRALRELGCKMRVSDVHRLKGKNEPCVPSPRGYCLERRVGSPESMRRPGGNAVSPGPPFDLSPSPRYR
jgi:hypothetical protein